MILMPISNDPNQTFKVAIPREDGSGNLNVEIFASWNPFSNVWQADITDADKNLPLIRALPLVTGKFPAGDILAPYQYLGIGHSYIVPVGSGTGNPGVGDWGVNYEWAWEI